MPRVSTKTEEENVEQKTPRKRAAPKKTATKTAKAKAAPRKTATKKAPAKRKTPAKKVAKKESESKEVVQEAVSEETEVREATATVSKRKAPTVFANEAAKKRAIKTQTIVIGFLLVMGIGASAAVGFTDSTAGQIDVAQTIKDRNARMANMVDVDGPTVVSPIVSNREGQPDGGFIAAAQQPAPTPTPVAQATSSASSTDTMASTTLNGTSTEAQPLDTNRSATTDSATTTVTAVDRSVADDLGTLPESVDNTPADTEAEEIE